jgi:hypothetical protein
MGGRVMSIPVAGLVGSIATDDGVERSLVTLLRDDQCR